MADERDVSRGQLGAPALTAPIEGKAIEDPSAVTFRWEELEGATSYQLQVSEDERFDELVLNVDVGDHKARTVKGIFEERDRTYYWRVRARSEDGTWGPYSEPSRFSVPTEEQLDTMSAEAERPEEVEERGPAAELVTAAATEAAAQVTGEEELEDAAHEMGVAEEGIPAKQIVILTAITLFIVGGLIVVIFWIYLLSTEDILTGTQAQVDYPELREMRVESTRRLTQYDVVDQQEEVYTIPIDRAIELVLQEYQSPEDAPALPTPQEEPTPQQE